MISILFMPIIQLTLMPLAANYEVKNIELAVVDHDHSSYSRKLIEKINASKYFSHGSYVASYDDAAKLIEKNTADIIMEIPHGFEENLIRDNGEKVFIAVNAINGTKANIGSGYLNYIIADFNSDVRLQWAQPSRFNAAPSIDIVPANWYNPFLSYFLYMVPGLVVSLLTGLCIFSSALNIVREKEIGTIEQINVTPVKKYEFILAKLIPYWVLAMVVFSIGMLVSRFIYGIVPLGSILMLYGFLSVYLVTLLGAGLLISTYSDTQQQAVSLAFFFMLIFNMISGVFTSIDSMPDWGKALSFFSPMSHFAAVMRMVVLKGSTYSDILYHFLAVVFLGLIFNIWAIVNYRKTT